MNRRQKRTVMQAKGGISFTRSSDIIFLVVLVLGLAVFAVNITHAATISCSFVSANNCVSPNVSILYVQNDTGGYENAHAQNSTNTTFARYNYALCCSSPDAIIGNSCSEAKVLKLFNITDSHVQVGNYTGPNSTYDIAACLSVDLGNVTCTYPTGSCPGGSSCVASIASSEDPYNLTNAHLGSCNKYDRKICCGAANTAPTVTLLAPADASTTTDRTPIFNWSGSDGEGDSLTYELLITCYNVTGSVCSGKGTNDTRYYNRTQVNSNVSFEIPGDLVYLYDNQFYYNWTVRAHDGQVFGQWATPFRLNISAIVSISLPTNFVNFGPIAYRDSNDTTDDSPLPFIIQNDGNSFVNISYNSTDLWSIIGNPSKYYQIKINNASGEAGAFNWGQSITSFSNTTNTSVYTLLISTLNYTNATDSSRIDLAVEVPASEPPANRSSLITFNAILNE